jgi:hypothetical protein
MTPEMGSHQAIKRLTGQGFSRWKSHSKLNNQEILRSYSSLLG